MRALTDYDRADWKRLRPITHAYKTATYRLVDAGYLRYRAQLAEPVLRQLARSDVPGVVFSIAFDTPWVIRWQIDACARCLADATLVICDNSRDKDATREIRELAEEAGVPWLRLPRNPWRSASRSHAAAMNWVRRNLAERCDADFIGFVDHDLIPTETVRLASNLAGQPLYGLRRNIGERWFLWAGYCFFDRQWAQANRLDFSQDWFYGLDTGGRNYRLHYRHLDAAGFRFAGLGRRSVEGAGGEPMPVEFVDTWLHVTNASGWNPAQPVDPAFFTALAAVPERLAALARGD